MQFITVYTELLYKESKTKIAFFNIIIKSCLPLLKKALDDKYNRINQGSNNCNIDQSI